MGSFLDACGASGPLHWTVGRPGTDQADRLTLDLPYLLVGRGPDADLCLRHPDVGDRHAYLQLVGGRVFCLDLGSRTGTHVDGRNWRSGWVEPRATIRIGPYRIRLDAAGDRRPPADPAGLTLEVAHRSLRSSSCAASGPIVLVGSSADCPARLVDPSVSDYHCALLPTPKGTWVVDLLGRGGVAINGVAARVGRVFEGDVLRLGGSTVRLRPRAGETPVPAGDGQAPGVPALAVPAPIPAVDLAPWISGLSPEKAEVARDLLAPLVQQMGLMQQQMFDRLQQAERERSRALAALQLEQFGAIREELDQLVELRQELDELRGELKAQGRTPSARGRSAEAAVSRPRLGSAAPAGPREAPAASPPAPGPPDVLRLSVGEAS